MSAQTTTTSIQKLYTAVAKATGGRDGRAVSDDQVIDIPLSTPKALGGAGKAGATNPEQLFAAGYSACFDSALSLVARLAKTPITGSTVEAHVSLGKDETGGFGLAVELFVNIPNMELSQVENLVQQAHQVCPYSRATRGNVEVQLHASNNPA
jgi:lipoyl-dependent peroxiredoxin